MASQVEHALVFLQKAKDDLFMANELRKSPQSPDWGIGFHAQQAVEKAIKSVLVIKGIPFTFSHDLSHLLNLLPKDDLPRKRKH